MSSAGIPKCKYLIQYFVFRIHICVFLSDAVRLSCCQNYNAGPAMQPSHKSLYICNGNENDLSECRMTTHVGSTCSHNQDESIICSKLINSKLACLYAAKMFLNRMSNGKSVSM